MYQYVLGFLLVLTYQYINVINIIEYKYNHYRNDY